MLRGGRWHLEPSFSPPMMLVAIVVSGWAGIAKSGVYTVLPARNARFFTRSDRRFMNNLHTHKPRPPARWSKFELRPPRRWSWLQGDPHGWPRGPVLLLQSCSYGKYLFVRKNKLFFKVFTCSHVETTYIASVLESFKVIALSQNCSIISPDGRSQNCLFQLCYILLSSWNSPFSLSNPLDTYF